MIGEALLEKSAENFVEKIFSGIKDFTGYQIDKIKINNLCNEAYNKIKNLDQVKTINDFGDSISLYDFFVPPQLIDLKESDKEFNADSLEDFRCNKKILISGIVGQGKSILMRHLAIQEAFKANKLSIFLELRELEDNESLENFMRRGLKSWLVTDNDKVITYLLKEGKVTFFFDGFDEIKTSNMEKIVQSFEKITRKYEKLNFVVSSRPEDSIDKSVIFKKYMIKKLDLDAQIKIIKKLVNDTILQNNLKKALSGASDNLIGVLVTPLMVNFYVYLYKIEQITGDNIKSFYNKLFDLVSRKHDGTKLLYKRIYSTNLNSDQLEEIFECICYLSCYQRAFFFNEYNLREYVDKAIRYKNIKCNTDDLIKDLTTGLCFIIKESDSFAFMHTSIAEFFAAKFIIKNIESDRIRSDLIENYNKYSNVIEYIKLIDSRIFYLYYIKNIFDNNYSFFKNKKILENIFISTKFYNKRYSESDYLKSRNNKISVIIFFEKIVHPYFVFKFLKNFDKFVQDDISNKYKFVTSFEFEFLYTEKSISDSDDLSKNESVNLESTDNNSSRLLSENYYLYETIDVKSEHGTKKGIEVREKMESEGFVNINSNHSFKLENINYYVNNFILELDEMKNKIYQYERSNSVDDLF